MRYHVRRTAGDDEEEMSPSTKELASPAVVNIADLRRDGRTSAAESGFDYLDGGADDGK
jgi:hypothetical protein